jgi:O-Antigen ligase
MIRKNFLSYIRFLLYGLTLLFLFHFETTSIGPVKVSHLWKGAVLAYLIFVICREKKLKIFIYGPLLGISVLQLVNIELYNNPFDAVLLFSTTVIIPLIGIYVLRFKPEQLKLSLMFFSSFFILSFVPYQIGLLSSLSSGLDLVHFGSDEKGILGPFQEEHTASTALASSLLVVVYFWLSNAYSKWLLSVLFALGFYFLFFTYIRTGMAMFAIGLLPIAWFFGKQSLVKFLRLAIVLSFSTLLIFSWVLSNETMMSRITGERITSSETESFEQLGSGRGLLYLSSLQIYGEASITEKIIGVGRSEALQRMGDKFLHAPPHNGFLSLLLNNGILALLLFLSFIRNMYKLQKGMHQLDSRILIQSLLLAYMTMTFFQNYDLLYPVLLLMLCIAFSYNTQLIRNRIQI